MFSVIDFTADKLTLIADKIVDVTGNLFSKLFFRKKKGKGDYDEKK